MVRDDRGRPVTTLEQRDFTLFDRGRPRPITSFDRDPGPVGLALLFDISGSMDLVSRLDRAREAAFFLLSGLRSGVDEAAIYAFDSKLHLVQPFTANIDELRGRMTTVDPFGATSLHDAIAAAAESVAAAGTRRRALVVLTDGIDTSSRLMRMYECRRLPAASSGAVTLYVTSRSCRIARPPVGRRTTEISDAPSRSTS